MIFRALNIIRTMYCIVVVTLTCGDGVAAQVEDVIELYFNMGVLSEQSAATRDNVYLLNVLEHGDIEKARKILYVRLCEVVWFISDNKRGLPLNNTTEEMTCECARKVLSQFRLHSERLSPGLPSTTHGLLGLKRLLKGKPEESDVDELANKLGVNLDNPTVALPMRSSEITSVILNGAAALNGMQCESNDCPRTGALTNNNCSTNKVLPSVSRGQAVKGAAGSGLETRK